MAWKLNKHQGACSRLYDIWTPKNTFSDTKNGIVSKKGWVQQVFIIKVCIFLRLLVKHNALQWPCYLFSSLKTFPYYGGIRSKKYFIYHRTANTIQLVTAIKGNFSGLFFFWTSHSEVEFPKRLVDMCY